MTDHLFPLGRLVDHDPRSLNYPAERATSLISVEHPRAIGALDQKRLGDCTANAASGALFSSPVFDAVKGALTQLTSLTDTKAIEKGFVIPLYESATKLDGLPGTYPPDDTGSTSLGVAKACKALGLISSYKHAFGLLHTLQALVLRPVIIGIPWFESMFQPDSAGFVSIAPGSQVAGGHEVQLSGLNVNAQTVTFWNSWGSGWAIKGQGRMTWQTLDDLLHQQGDAMVLIP